MAEGGPSDGIDSIGMAADLGSAYAASFLVKAPAEAS
jgi:hypothetical protein